MGVTGSGTRVITVSDSSTIKSTGTGYNNNNKLKKLMLNLRKILNAQFKSEKKCKIIKYIKDFKKFK